MYSENLTHNTFNQSGVAITERTQGTSCGNVADDRGPGKRVSRKTRPVSRPGTYTFLSWSGAAKGGCPLVASCRVVHDEVSGWVVDMGAVTACPSGDLA